MAIKRLWDYEETIEGREDAATKAAQVAAIRQRLGDIAAGACGCNNSFRMGVERAFDLVKVYPHHLGDTWTLNNLDSLAAWLWERGVR